MDSNTKQTITLDQMRSTYGPNCKSKYKPRVGFEWEVQLFTADWKPLNYQGAQGLDRILIHAQRQHGGMRSQPNNGAGPANKLALPDGSGLSLEPGGQFEYSSAPAASFADVTTGIEFFEQLLQDITKKFDVHVFFGGMNPVHSVDDIGLVIDTPRYQRMNRYFPTVGTRGRAMMRQSCSLQVSFDYENHEDAATLLRAAQYLAPLCGGLFANSPFVDGKRNQYLSNRVPVWFDTDPARCGPVPGFTDNDFSIDRYINHIRDAPLFFLERPNDAGQIELIETMGATFRDLNTRKLAPITANMDDYELHKSTIFTDVRLKNTVELRTIDCQRPEFVPGILAFLSGLLFCKRARQATISLLSQLDVPDWHTLSLDLAKDPYNTPLRQMAGTESKLQDVALQLLASARNGLSQCFEDGAQSLHHLDAIEGLFQAARTPAHDVLDTFGDNDAQGWLKSMKI